MASFGRNTVGVATGNPIMVLADGLTDGFKHAGITIDWATITAVSGANATLADGTVVKVGDKSIRYGTVLDLIGTSEVQTLTFTGGPTGGGAIITLPASGSDAAQVTTSVSAIATAADMAAALNALGRLAPNGASVARTGAGTAGDPYIYTITFANRLGDVPQLTSTNTFTGGTAPTTTHGTTTAGSGTGKYGPANTAATDGRAVLERGQSYILNTTVVESSLGSDHAPVFDEGLVWWDRVLKDGLNEPTSANILAAFPAIRLVRESV